MYNITLVDDTNIGKAIGRLGVCYDPVSEQLSLPKFDVIPSDIKTSELQSRRLCIIPMEMDEEYALAHPEHGYRSIDSERVRTSYAVDKGKNYIMTASRRFLCPDNVYGIASMRTPCVWNFSNPDSATRMQYMVSSDAAFLAHVKHDELSLLHGSSIVFMGADLRLRAIEETDYVFVPIPGQTLAHSTLHDDVQFSSKKLFGEYLGQKNETRFTPSLSLKAASRISTISLKGVRTAIGAPIQLENLYPRWSSLGPTYCLGKTIAIDSSFYQPQSATPQCFAYIEHMQALKTNVKHSYVLTTTMFSIAFSLEFGSITTMPVSSQGWQVVMDLSSRGLFRVEVERIGGDDAKLALWTTVPNTDSAPCSVSGVQNSVFLYYQSTRLTTTHIQTRAYVDTKQPGSLNRCADVEKGQVSSLSLCGSGPESTICRPTKQENAWESVLPDQAFLGKLSQISFWQKRLTPYEIKLLASSSGNIGAVHLWNTLMSNEAYIDRVDNQTLQDTEWHLQCRPDLLTTPSRTSVSFANSFGGVRCVAASIASPNTEIDFIPLFHCHSSGVSPCISASTPYKCSDGRCYKDPGDCEKIAVDYSCIRQHEETQSLLSSSELSDQWVLVARDRPNLEEGVADNLLLQCTGVGTFRCVANENMQCANYPLITARGKRETLDKFVLPSDLQGLKYIKYSCDDIVNYFPQIPADMCRNLGCVASAAHASMVFTTSRSGLVGGVSENECAISCYEAQKAPRREVYQWSKVGNSSQYACYNVPPAN